MHAAVGCGSVESAASASMCHMPPAAAVDRTRPAEAANAVAPSVVVSQRCHRRLRFPPRVVHKGALVAATAVAAVAARGSIPLPVASCLA